MSLPKPVKKETIIKLSATLLSFILVLIFAPRMNAPRIINGIEFSSKSGGPGLTNLGWLLLILVPISVFFLSGLLIKMMKK